MNKELSDLASRANISLTMIVRDEERRLADCLQSVAGVFTQTVIVETGSKDNTKDIAREFGVELYEAPWRDSFAAARNEALSKATGQWVFWMDADETIPAESVEPILRRAIEATAEVAGFIVPVQFAGSDATRADHIKLFRNIEGLQWRYRVHEQIYPALREHGRIERLDAFVLHTGYDNTPQAQHRKRARNDRLLKLDFKDSPDDPLVLFNLGVEAHGRERHMDAVRWLEKAIPLIPPSESYIRKAFALLAGSRQGVGDVAGALTACEVGLKLLGTDPELHFRAGQALGALGRYEEAKQQYLLVADRAPDYFSSLDTEVLGPKRDHNLAVVCMQLGEQFEAKEWLRKAIDARFPQSAVALFEFALNQNDETTASSALDSLKEMDGVTGLWTVLATKLAVTRGQSEESFLEETVAHYPEATAPALLLAKKLLDSGREQEAEPFLKFLEKKGHPDAPFLRGAVAGRKGEFVSAIAHTQRALELEPSHEGAKYQLEVLKRAMGKS
jgi:tetratricopeptide (TPR) repeat protein